MNNPLEDFMTDQRKSWMQNVMTSIITSLAVLAGSWFAFQGDTDSADANRLESAFTRISHLETAMREQQANSNAKIIELTSQVFRLKSQLNSELDIVEMFEKFMDGLPFDAWLKEVNYNGQGEARFRMLLINKRYEFNHGVSSDRYKGQLDSEIWGEKVAKEFRKNDLKALRNKSSVVTYETYPIRQPDGTMKDETMLIVKVYVEFLDGRETVFGMAIDIPDQSILQEQ